MTGTFGGQGRRAGSLGAADPRARRDAQAQANSDVLADPPLKVGNDGRLSLEGATGTVVFYAATAPGLAATARVELTLLNGVIVGWAQT